MKTSNAHDWVSCPICGEDNMNATSLDEDGHRLIFCVNLSCASNGGDNASALLARRAPAPALAAPRRALTAGLPEMAMKPMSSAPKPVGDEHFKILALDEWTESGQVCRGWALLYWLDAFDGSPAGWHGENCGDLRHPLGWVMTTRDLPES